MRSWAPEKRKGAEPSKVKEYKIATVTSTRSRKNHPVYGRQKWSKILKPINH